MFSISLPASAEEPPEEILSKVDAQTVFAMSEKEWIANVRKAIDQGVARVTGSLESGIGMVTTTPEGSILIVRPMYFADKNRPSAIQVIVGYRPAYSKLLSDEKIKATVEEAKKEMLPDYLVHGEIKKIKDGTTVFFIIEENR